MLAEEKSPTRIFLRLFATSRSEMRSSVKKEKPGINKIFLLQGIFLGILLAGMNASFCHTLFPIVPLRRISLLLGLVGIWCAFLMAHPFERIEHRMHIRGDRQFIRYPLADAGILLTLAGVAAVVLLRLELYRQYMYDLGNAIEYWYGKYTGGNEGAFVAEQFQLVSQKGTHVWAGSSLLLLLGILLGLLMAWCFQRRRGFWLGILPAVAVVCLELLLGLSPSMPDMLWLIIGSLGMRFATAGQKQGGRRIFRQREQTEQGSNSGIYWTVSLLSVIVLAAAVILTLLCSDRLSGYQDAVLDQQHIWEQNAKEEVISLAEKFRQRMAGQVRGVMTNTAPKYKDKPIAFITMDSKPVDSIYLRVYTGTVYQDGKWSATDLFSKKFREEEGKYILEMGEQFSEYTYDYLNDTGDVMRDAIEDFNDDDEQAKIERQYSMQGNGHDILTYPVQDMNISYPEDTEYKKEALLPYYSRLLALKAEDDYQWHGDLNLTRRSTKQSMDFRGFVPPVYYSDSCLGDQLVVWKGMDIGDRYASDVMMRTAGADTQETLSEEEMQEQKKYEEFIVDQYCQLPKSGLERTIRLAKALEKQTGDGMDDEYPTGNAMVRKVKKFLGDIASYSTQLSPKTTGVDFVEDFLFNQKKGYCEHFASAGTILYRAMGVPARYVSGYRIDPDEFRQTEDGSYTADILDSDAHAWAEIYEHRTGWIPADVTGSSNDGGRQKLSAEKMIESATPKPSPTGKSAADEKADEPKQTTPAPSKTPSLQKKSSGTSGKGQGVQEQTSILTAGQKRGIAAGLFVLLLIAAWFVRHLIGAAWYRHCINRCSTRNEKILQMNRLFVRYLHHYGMWGLSHKSDSEYRALLLDRLPDTLDRECIMQYFEYLQAAKYGENERTVDEVRWCRTFLRRAAQELAQQKKNKHSSKQ